MSGRAATRWLDRIAELSRPDRDWILANLSGAAKASLRRQARLAAGSAASDSASDVADERALDALDASTVAAYLAQEPSWVIAMVLSVRSWRWESAVLAKAPIVTRHETMQLQASLPRISAAMTRQLVRTLRNQLLPEAEGSQRFEQLLDGAQKQPRVRV